MKRTHRREFVMNDEEAADLTSKARAACMTESGLIRMLVSGYQPPPHPDKEFFDDMGKLLESGDRLAEAARHMGKGECRSEVIREAGALKELRMEFERKYLTTKEENIWR